MIIKVHQADGYIHAILDCIATSSVCESLAFLHLNGLYDLVCFAKGVYHLDALLPPIDDEI
jgi:hypothetical protein